MNRSPRTRTAPLESTPAGELLRQWRQRRGRSQMDLALSVGVSTRHLSCVETGRARPSPATLLALAEALEVPLRERNRLLVAAGHAPRFHERPIDSPELAAARQALQRLLDAHHPYPGIALDRQWNVVLANGAAQALMGLMPAAVLAPQPNAFRVGLHPQGLAAHTLNFAEWGLYLLRQLARQVERAVPPGQARGTHAPAHPLAALQAEVLAYPNVRALTGGATLPAADDSEPLLVPCVLQLGGQRVAMFTTLTAFGTPRDVTLDELCVELFYPADADSAALLRAMAAPAAT